MTSEWAVGSHRQAVGGKWSFMSDPDTGQVRGKKRLAIVSRMGRKARIFSEGKAGQSFSEAFFKTLPCKKLQHDGTGLENESDCLIKMLAGNERKMLWKTNPKVWTWPLHYVLNSWSWRGNAWLTNDDAEWLLPWQNAASFHVSPYWNPSGFWFSFECKE